MKNILIIAAENSAENYGSKIIDQFRKSDQDVSFFGEKKSTGRDAYYKGEIAVPSDASSIKSECR